MSSISNASIPSVVPVSKSNSSAAGKTAKPATDLQQLNQLAAGWRLLGQHTNSPINQFEWSMACAAAFAPTQRLNVMMVGPEIEPIAIAPLHPQTLNGIGYMAMLGVQELHEPMDLVYRDQEALDCLVSALLRDGQPLLLERLPADSLTVTTFHRLCRRRAAIVQRPQMSWPYIALDETWREPENNLNSGRRSDLRRARRHAQDKGPLSTQIITPKLDELDLLLDEAFRIEAASWKGQTGTALACDATRAAFYRHYAHAAAERGILRLCFLRIDQHPVAMQLAIEHGGGFWLLKIGYDAQYAQCSPGMLLLRDTIQYAVEKGLKSYEFLGLVAPWTQVWTRQYRDSVSLRVYPASVRGTSAFFRAASGSLFRKWRLNGG